MNIVLMSNLVLPVFFASAKYRVVKIVCSYSDVVLQTMKNYKAHYIFILFRAPATR
jgi:hypothetical protein